MVGCGLPCPGGGRVGVSGCEFRVPGSGGSGARGLGPGGGVPQGPIPPVPSGGGGVATRNTGPYIHKSRIVKACR